MSLYSYQSPPISFFPASVSRVRDCVTPQTRRRDDAGYSGLHRILRKVSTPWFERRAEVVQGHKLEFSISTLSVNETIRQPPLYSMLLKALQLTIRCFHKLLTKSVLYRTIFAIVSCLGSSKHIPKRSRNVVAELSASLRSQGRSGCENARLRTSS